MAGLAVFPSLARADVEHVVGKGHTLTAIANRYHVSVQSIIDKNGIRNPKSLQLGQVLIIPVGGKNGGKGGDVKQAAAAKSDPKGKQGDRYAARAKEPGVVRAHRLATNEDYVLHVGRGRRIPAATLGKAKQMFRSGAQTHAIDARLLALLGVVSDHFGSRPIEVISGYRPYKSTQYTKDSRHNHGKAVDFRVVGVPNKVVVEFCKTLRNTGCGYYPNSVFVHMDARDKNETWIDYSRPGEAPKYDKAAPGADEGTSDVHAAGGKADSAKSDSEAEAAESASPPSGSTTTTGKGVGAGEAKAEE